VQHPTEPLLQPKSIAIIGASDSRATGWSQRLFDNFAHSRPDTKLFLVNPNRTELWGHKVHPNFAAIGEPVDLGLCVIPSHAVVDALSEAAENGLRCALIYASQFGEGGDPEGDARAQALLGLRDRYGMRISGPNCMGVLSLRERHLLYPAPRVRAVPAGPVGVIFQSGGTFQYWLQQAAVRGLGFSYAVSSGNELDLGMADYLDFMVDDPETRVIACLAEGIRRPEAFMKAAARALRAGKPLAIVKSGRSARGKAAALSHTGALAGDDAVFDAMCERYGITRCDSLDDMIETCLALQAGRLPTSPDVAIVTFSGSAKGMMLDYAEDSALALTALEPATNAAITPLLDPGMAPDNPLDIGATVANQPKRFAEICKLIAADANVGSLMIQASLPSTDYDNRDPSTFADIAASTDKPVLAWSRTAHNVTEESRAFQAAAGLPFLQGMPQVARAASALTRFAAAQSRGERAAPARGTSGPLPAQALNAALERAGMTLPRSLSAPDAAAAARAAEAIGFPVALKLVSPAALHKTEVGGVALGLRSAAEVARAAGDMMARLQAAQPDAPLEGFLVQEMVSGAELLLGARTDPLYGPILMVGLGGVATEALRDTAIRLLPIDAEDARAMLGSLRARALLGEFRGRPARDVEAVVRAMLGLSDVFLEHAGWLADIEVNPLMVLEAGKGVRAVDLRCIRKEDGTAH
jgi:acetyltransferase